MAVHVYGEAGFGAQSPGTLQRLLMNHILGPPPPLSPTLPPPPLPGSSPTCPVSHSAQQRCRRSVYALTVRPSTRHQPPLTQGVYLTEPPALVTRRSGWPFFSAARCARSLPWASPQTWLRLLSRSFSPSGVYTSTSLVPGARVTPTL